MKILKILTIITFCMIQIAFAQTQKQDLSYVVSMPQAENNKFHMEFKINGINKDSIFIKMPKWMPGYYQIMDYANEVENISAYDTKGKVLSINKINENTWCISAKGNKYFTVSYDIKTRRQFVANSFIDSTHAYIVPENNFFYIDGFLNLPVKIKIIPGAKWNKIATGLETIAGKTDEFIASDFDILYDCPILIGNLEELPAFKINGIEHRFIGYKLGNFDKELFMTNLKKVVESAVNIMGDIPYKQYTFIGIGPGRGGIEHLNSTTLSFDGNSIKTPKDINRMMNFIGHEYFHHYNVKRIRPFELGPFDYDKENKTNLLWISEGLTVYYEYVVVKSAGFIDDNTFFADFEDNINALENNQGRFYQSLSQSSYNTWNDGPFGTNGNEKGKTISYYDKGPVVGLLLDFAIRNATQNKKSLDDLMRLLYWEYYKKLKRGFTDAELQQACESISGIPLSEIFEYIYTTKEPDYNKYLNYAGLKLEIETSKSENNKETKNCKLIRLENPNALQGAILKAWLRE